jgi:hypothetical protein
MCGDFKEAIELAVGAPRKVSATGADDEERRPWLDIPEPTAKELREFEKARRRGNVELMIRRSPNWRSE